MKIRITARDEIRFYEEQPESVILGEWPALEVSGSAIYTPDGKTLIIRHEDGLGWRVPGEEFIWSDLSLAMAPASNAGAIGDQPDKSK